jgi:hypothetical protein
MINKLERRFGHMGIPGLIRYVLALSIFGNILNLIRPGIYTSFLSFDVYKILHGQIWRLVTFLMSPSLGRDSGFIVDLIWYVIWLSLYYFVGSNLEQQWGTFRFNLYYISGIVLIWIAGFITYFVYLFSMGTELGMQLGYYLGSGITSEYLNLSLFLAFAAMFPDVQFLLYFIIPVKAKWLGILDLVLLGVQLVVSLTGGDYVSAALIVAALVNFGIYFLSGRGRAGSSKAAYRQKKRRMEYRKKMSSAPNGMGTIHRCAICGRTEKDAPHLEFRYCSKCEGNYEYCSDHLFTHQHVHQ